MSAIYARFVDRLDADPPPADELDRLAHVVVATPWCGDGFDLLGQWARRWLADRDDLAETYIGMPDRIHPDDQEPDR